MSEINPVLSHYSYDGKSGYLKIVDRVLSSVYGKEIKIIGQENEYTGYSVKSKKNNCASVSKTVGLSICLVIPIFLFLKAISPENRRIAKKVTTLEKSSASIEDSSNKVNKVKSNSEDLPPPAETKKEEPPVPPPTFVKQQMLNEEGDWINFWTLGYYGTPPAKKRNADQEKIEQEFEIVAGNDAKSN